MNLIDLIEMVCDWKAASLRMKDGDFLKYVSRSRKNVSGSRRSWWRSWPTRPSSSR